MTKQYQSTSSVAEDLDRQRTADERFNARNANLSKAEIIQGLDRLCVSKARWIVNFSQGRNARPAHEIQAARHSLAAMQMALDVIQNMSVDQFDQAGGELIAQGVRLGRSNG
ncbi:hypothetical protein HGO34_15735 [Agrobacterium vitis]|uniref:hypothetical protein n=1 Tax=Agrobacterium vitis TaxID=373 RepID=UPI001F19FF2F|nr:hypothetical protein [Agrobacterium vitis]MCF1498925.1 hypothetical protein [Allorhizobium sp. Av2]MCM2441173.1 hypothetical protein [Agrobacterium vitis]